MILPSSEPAAFLGRVVMSGNRRRLPEENVRRFRKRLRGLRDRWRAGTVTQEEVEQRVGSWVAHAAHADTWRLRRAVFRGGWFDPLYQLPWKHDGAPCGRRAVRGLRNNSVGFHLASTLSGRIRGGQGCPGCASERPGPVMMSTGPLCRGPWSRAHPGLRATGAVSCVMFVPIPCCALVLIGSRGLGARDDHGHRRLDDPDDWVWLEIEESVKRLSHRADPPRHLARTHL